MNPFVAQILPLVRTAARRWHILLIACGLAAGLTIAVSMRGSRSWTVTTVFAPEAGKADGLGGLGAELGLEGPGMDSPDFYVEYLKTGEAVRQVVRRKYLRSAGDSVTLPALFKMTKGDSGIIYANATRTLMRMISTVPTRRANIVTVKVSLPDPLVSVAVAEEILGAINDLNSRVRQTRGRVERQFAEDRLKIIQKDLSAAEGALLSFLQTNRPPISDPGLVIEKLRLERAVSHHAAVLSSLQVAFEQARTDEVRNTPRISIVQPPRFPVIGNPRGTGRKAVVSALMTAGGLLLLFFLADLRGGGTVRGLFHWTRVRLSEIRATPTRPAA